MLSYKNYKRRVKLRIGRIEFMQREINRRLHQKDLLDIEIEKLIKRQNVAKEEIRNIKTLHLKK